MTRAHTAAALLLALLVAPGALAGTEADPEMVDGRDAGLAPAHDILAAWLDDTPEGPRFTVKVAGLPVSTRAVLYELTFTAGLDREGVAVGYDGSGAVRSSVDTPSGWSAPGNRATRLDDALLQENAKNGSPGYMSAVLPRERFGLEPGVTLRFLVIRSTYYDEAKREWVIGADEVFARSSFTIDADQVAPSAWPPLLIVFAFALAGGGAGWWAAKKWRRAKK